ncbi:unnamed protein product [Closterium sp. NIES-53]
MASLNVLTFDAEGRAVDFEVWLDDLQLFLQCDSKDGLSLFDLTSGASTAPTADADSTIRSQWLTRDAAARLAVRNHLPSTERAHFSQYKSARALYDAVVACYSSPTTAALSRLMLPRLLGVSLPCSSSLLAALPPLPPGPAPTCVPCVEGRQRAVPHSSSFPPTGAPLQTLHMDVWGPARVRGQGHKRYFLLVVDDYSRYTTVFPLRSKGEVPEVLIDWIRGARRQLSESFGADLPVLRLHSDRGAYASPAIGPSSAEALHTCTLDSGASRFFFRDCTTLTPLAAPVPVSLADPTRGPVVARASTILPCLAVPSDSLSGLHLPTFSTNLVSNAAIQDVWVDTFIPGGQRVAILSAFGQLAASCSCRVLSHQTLLWHHCLGHPPLPRLRSMHSHLLVYGLPRSLPSLPCSPAPPCLPYVEGQQRAAPHSSEFPPLLTLHMDVWGPTPIGGTDQERYFLLVVDDYTRYTTVFPLRRKAGVSGVLIPLIRATRSPRAIQSGLPRPASAL